MVCAAGGSLEWGHEPARRLGAAAHRAGRCHRVIGVAADPADWRDASKFYSQEPSNWYSKFLHEHSIDQKAYGFCYDDYADQAAYFSGKGPELTVTLHWNGAR